MTDEQIIKALECCSYATYNSDCEKCPYYPDKECVKKQCTDIIDLIKRQKTEIVQLKQNLEEAHIDIKEHMVEIERLKGRNNELASETYTSTRR